MRTTGAALASMMLAAFTSVANAQADPRVYTPQFGDDGQAGDIPNVQVWLNESTVHFGDLIRPYVTSDPNAYITVVRVTTDGALQVLYPQFPTQQRRYNPAEFANDRLPMNSTGAFLARESRGVGFVFAIASYYKFNYRYYTSGRNWSTTRLASAGRFGSPFQIVRSFVEEVTEGSESYSMDYVMYEVDFDQYRSRYASRFRGYGYDDYFDMCLGAFGSWYSSYCRGYNGFGYPYIVVQGPRTPRSHPQKPGMALRPLVHDPNVRDVPRRPAPAVGTQARINLREEAALSAARRERMLRDARPRHDPMLESRADPRMQAPRMQEPRMQPPPQREPARAAPVLRSEPHVERPHREAPAPRIERREPAKKDN